MGEHLKLAVASLLSPSCTLGINIRLQKVLGLLQQAGLVYSMSLRPADFMVHPQNRGGSMLNAWSCHRKGSDILAGGIKADLLPPNSLAVEIAIDEKTKSTQILANEKMIQEF